MESINIWKGTPLGYNKEFDETNKGLPYIDEFVINDGKKHPCILIIPGGGYDHLSDHEGANVAEELNKNGVSAFVLYYRIAPYRHPVYLYDVKRAMRYIRYNAERYNIISDKIGVMGFSAGGHLACICAENAGKFQYEPIDEIDAVSDRPDILCMCYPVVTITNENIFHKRSGDNIAGDNNEVRQALSAELAVPENMPPTFIWHTFEDASVDCRNSLDFCSAMKAKGNKFELHIFPNGRHGLDFAKGIYGTDQWFELFLNWAKGQNFII